MHQIGESRTKKPQQQLNTPKTATSIITASGSTARLLIAGGAILLCRFFAAVLIPLALAGVSYA